MDELLNTDKDQLEFMDLEKSFENINNAAPYVDTIDPLGVFFDDTDEQNQENSPGRDESISNDPSSWDTVMFDVPMESDDYFTREFLVNNSDAFENDTDVFEEEIDTFEEEIDALNQQADEKKGNRSYIISLIVFPDSFKNFKENTKNWKKKKEENTVKISFIDFSSLQNSLITIGSIAAIIFGIKKLRRK